MPTGAAVVFAIAIAMGTMLVPFVAYVAADGDSAWVLPLCAAVGVAAGTWFFVSWWRRDPKRRRAREAARRKREREATQTRETGPR